MTQETTRMLDTIEREDVRRARDPQGRALRWADMTATIRTDGAAARFRGEAIVFDEWTWIGSKRFGFRERIAPGAVTRALEEDDVRFLINHDPNLLLGRNTAGTVDLKATKRALQVDADLPDVSYARDLAVSLERGDVSGMSFAFEILSETHSIGDDDENEFTIDELRLYDVSVVTYPAYEQTNAGLRSEGWEVLCRSVGIDPVAERQLLRDLTGADGQINDALAEKARAIVEESGDEPGGDPDEPASRAGGAPDGEPEVNPGDHLRDRRLSERFKNEEGKE